MKKYFITYFVLFLVTFCTLSNAEDIVIIDVEKVVGESTAFKEFQEKFETEKTKIGEELKQRELDLRSEQEDIESKMSILSKEAQEKKIMEFQKKVMEFQEYGAKRETELREQFAAAIAKLHEEIKVVTAELIEKNKYDYEIVLNKAAVIYNNKEIKDISLDVLRLLNRKNIKLHGISTKDKKN